MGSRKTHAETAPMTVARLFADAVERHETRTMIEFEGGDLSYGEMGEAVRRVASVLVGRGAGPGTAIALYMPNTPEFAIVFFAAMAIGAHAVNLSPLDAPRELRLKLKDSGARILATVDAAPLAATAAMLQSEGLIDLLVLGDGALVKQDKGNVAGVLRLNQAISTPAAPGSAPTLLDTDALALIQYTGGTTGSPKGAMLTHGALTSAVAMFDAAIHAEPSSCPGEERHIVALPLFHIYALVSILLRATHNGETLILRQRFDPQKILEDIAERRATFLFGVPTMFIALLGVENIESHNLTSLSYCVAGGGPVPLEVIERFARITGRAPAVGWGMTETCGAGTLSRTDDVALSGFVGAPLPGATIEIVAMDDPARLLAPGEAGEVRVKGPHIMSGYWRRPAESAAVFVDDGLLTGDVGYLDLSGNLILIDRKKDLIISAGFNVYPRNVEEAIYEHPGVEEAIVYGVPDDYRGEIPVAAVKMRSGTASFDLAELREFLADKLGRHELPAKLEIYETLPRTAVGKLSRKELRERASAKKGTIDA